MVWKRYDQVISSPQIWNIWMLTVFLVTTSNVFWKILESPTIKPWIKSMSPILAGVYSMVLWCPSLCTGSGEGPYTLPVPSHFYASILRMLSFQSLYGWVSDHNRQLDYLGGSLHHRQWRERVTRRPGFHLPLFSCIQLGCRSHFSFPMYSCWPPFPQYNALTYSTCLSTRNRLISDV